NNFATLSTHFPEQGNSLTAYDQMEALQNTLFIPELTGGSPITSESFKRLMAALRMSHHMMYDQPTIIVRRQLHQQQLIFSWVQHNTSDSEQLANARQQLENFQVWPDPSFAFWADQRLIERVLIGKELPTLFSEKPIPENAKLAHLANQLPWERQRAIAVNIFVTNRDAYDATSIVDLIETSHPKQVDQGVMQPLRPDYPADAWSIDFPQAATSYLFAEEYRARVRLRDLL